MGYETRLIFVECYDGSIDKYCKVIAELEMGKIACDEVGKLIETLQKENKTKYRKRAYELLKKLETTIEDDKKYQIERELFNEIPYFYTKNSENPIYDDKYGDLLLITDLETLRGAIAKNQEKIIKEDGKGYRRFDVALAIIDQLMDKDNWSENIKVILWGY